VGISSGTFIWHPPPAAAGAALEELRKARLKRQESTHIFLCPRLLTPEWMKALFKVSDVVFQVPAGPSFWPKGMFEPLTVGIVFPFISSPPWQLRGTPKMLSMVRKMRRVFEEGGLDAGNILFKFLLASRRLRSLPDDVVRRMLYFESRDPVPREAFGRRGGRKRERPEGSGKADKSVGKEEKVPGGLPHRKNWRPHNGPV
jgi:hypothetical protein